MKNIDKLFEHLPLLLEHAADILQYEPYYNCRVIADHYNLKYLPLGPFMEFWKDVPVNTAGKILLTKRAFTNSYAHDPSYDELMAESGFRDRHPLPGISLAKLTDIMRRFMLQYQDQTYLIGVSLEQVIRELQEAKPWGQRVSCGYLMLRDRVDEAVAAMTGTEFFTSSVVPAFTENYEQYYPKRYFNSPVFYRIQQLPDLSFKVVIELQVPTNYPKGRGFSFITSGGAVAVTETMQTAYEQMEDELIKDGYTKLASQVTLQEVGITGVFEKPFSLTEEGAPVPGEVEALGIVLNKLRAILEEHSLWREFHKALDLKAESPTSSKY